MPFIGPVSNPLFNVGAGVSAGVDVGADLVCRRSSFLLRSRCAIRARTKFAADASTITSAAAGAAPVGGDIPMMNQSGLQHQHWRVLLRIKCYTTSKGPQHRCTTVWRGNSRRITCGNTSRAHCRRSKVQLLVCNVKCNEIMSLRNSVHCSEFGTKLCTPCLKSTATFHTRPRCLKITFKRRRRHTD